MYNTSQLHQIYDNHANHNKSIRPDFPTNFESESSFKNVGFTKELGNAQQNMASTLLIPNLWEDAFGLDDLDLPDVSEDGFFGKSNQDSLNDIESNLDLLDLPPTTSNRSEWEDYESVSQDSIKTLPLVCNNTVLKAVDIGAIHEKEEKLKYSLIERDRHHSRKTGRKAIPDEMKDDRYWKRRLKNNLAAKRSRDAKRLKECEIEVKATCLETVNEGLRMQVSRLSAEISELRCRLAKYEGHQVLQELSSDFTKTGTKHSMKSYGEENDCSRRNKRNSSTPGYLKGFDLS